MPIMIDVIDLPTRFTYKEAYGLLNDEQKKQVITAICAKGLSKETFYRWLRENKVPLVWSEHFREQLNVHLNANGKNLL